MPPHLKNTDQRNIVSISFPLSDFSDFKRRPAIIISNNYYNSKQEDIVVMGITSQLEKQREYVIPVSNADMENGFLPFQSEIRCDKLLLVHKSKIVAFYGKLSKNKFIQTINQLNELVKETV